MQKKGVRNVISDDMTLKQCFERLFKTTESQHKEIKYLQQMITFLKRVVLIYSFLFGIIAVILVKLLTNQ